MKRAGIVKIKTTIKKEKEPGKDMFGNNMLRRFYLSLRKEGREEFMKQLE